MITDSLREDISTIIYDGILAPSGENSQPWRFVVEENSIHIFNIEGRDTTLYNAGQHGSYVSHGALLENMVISASNLGYTTTVDYFPNKTFNPVAKMVLEKDNSIICDPLYSAIKKRHTNRNEFATKKLTDAEKKELADSVHPLNNGNFILVDSQHAINVIAEAAALIEKLMFTSRVFHRFFFAHFFSKQKDEDTPSGLYVDLMGMSYFERFGISLIRFWSLATIFRLTGIANIIVTKRKNHYKKCAAFGAVVVDGNNNTDYINGGRLTERAWLTATKLDIDVQPCVGILYLWEGVVKATDTVFSQEEKDLIEEARNKILETFEVQGKTIPMLFRLGSALKPTIKSLRREPEIDYITN